MGRNKKLSSPVESILVEEREQGVKGYPNQQN